MLVDDDRTTIGLLKTLLELDGFEVSLSPKGETALEQAREFMPAAFVVDLNLADMYGTDVVRQLRADAQFANSAIIITSGMPKSEDAIESGADKFLLKPFDPTELVDSLRSLLGIT